MKTKSLIILFVLLNFQGYSQFDSDSKIQFNGIYVSDPLTDSVGTDSLLFLLRFYKDKTVISSTFVYANYNYEGLFLSFTKESMIKKTKYQTMGSWKASSDSIKFNINFNKIRITNTGSIIDSNTLEITTKSNKNKTPSIESYHFKVVDSNPIKAREFPKKLNNGDIIKVSEGIRSHGVIQSSKIKEFEIKEMNLIEMRFISSYADEYMFERSGDYKGDYKYLKKEANRFLRTNNIKLNKYYSEIDKPFKSLKGDWGGLQCLKPQTQKTDSTFTYTNDVLTEIESFYNRIVQDNFTQSEYYIAGSSRVYSIEVISSKEAYYLLQDRELRNGQNLSIKSKPN